MDVRHPNQQIHVLGFWPPFLQFEPNFVVLINFLDFFRSNFWSEHDEAAAVHQRGFFVKVNITLQHCGRIYCIVYGKNQGFHFISADVYIPTCGYVIPGSDAFIFPHVFVEIKISNVSVVILNHIHIPVDRIGVEILL